MPAGTRKALRRYVARRRRQRAWSHEQRMEHDRLVGKVIEGRRMLEATDGTAYFSAQFIKVNGQWKVDEVDPALEFLRYCGKSEDARKAMQRRRFVYRWRS